MNGVLRSTKTLTERARQQSVESLKEKGRLTRKRAEEEGRKKMLEEHADRVREGGEPTATEGISIFREEYRYWRRSGLNHVCAYNRAVDYYRKFTMREVTEDWELRADSMADPNAVDPEQYTYFNQMVSKAVNGLNPKERKFLFLVIRQIGVDSDLNEENTMLCDFYAGNHHPERMHEIAGIMGFSCQASGSSITAGNYRKRLQRVFESLGLVAS